MSKLFIHFLPLILVTHVLTACESKMEPEVIQVQRFTSAEPPYFVKEFMLLKQGKIYLLSTTATLIDGTTIHKSWGISEMGFMLMNDDTPASPEHKAMGSNTSDQEIENHLKTMKINKEIHYLKQLLSTNSKQECNIE